MRLVQEQQRQLKKGISPLAILGFAVMAQLHEVAVFVHRAALLIRLAGRQLAWLVTDRAVGKTRIERLVELVHERPALRAIGLAGQFAGNFTPRARRVVRLFRHYNFRLGAGYGRCKRQNAPMPRRGTSG